MPRDYPKDYTGPKAGLSDDKEWLAIREYQVYKWIHDGTWHYSDFDCYLAALRSDAFNFGLNMSEEDKQNYKTIYD